MVNILDDTGYGTVVNPGKQTDFKLAVSYLPPKDPVVKRLSSSSIDKRGVSEIYRVTDVINTMKDGIGRTGVYFRWHAPKSFQERTLKQKQELFDWISKKKGES